LRERRFDWSLSRVIAVGTAPGVIFGVFHRVSLLRSPDRFRIFMGVVLLTLAIKLVVDLMLIHGARRPRRALGASQRRWVVLVSVVVGFVGGVYGIGGGSIIAPFLVAVLGLSIYRVAGAALFATFVTFVTSVVGVLAFTNPGTPGG